MSAVKGVNVTKYDAGSFGSNVLDPGVIRTEIEVWTDSYEASALASGSTIQVADLPAGSKFIAGEIYFDALGGSSTLSMGDSTSATRYIAATDTSAAGVVRTTAIGGVGYVIGTATDDNKVLLTNAAGATSTGTIKTVVYYSR